MADDRPAESEVEAVARLQRELEDLRSTVMVRVGRSPTGTIAPVILTAAPADTLLLQGQTVLRASYPVLWQWASDNALVGVTGLFTAGDGTTNFVLPDFRGRVPLGAGTLGTDTYAVGAKGGVSAQVIAINQMPSHNHPTNSSGFTNTVGDHGHGTSGFTSGIGDHGGHVNGTVGEPGYAPTANPGWTRVSSWGNAGGHNHTVNNPVFGGGGHNHTIDASNQNVGGSTPLDNRPPFIALNWLIWA